MKKNRDLMAEIFLMCVILTAYIRFFLSDRRPFIDHSSHYICDGYFKYFDSFYEVVRLTLNKFFPWFVYDGFFAYRLISLILLVVVMFFVGRTTKVLYRHGTELFAVLFIATVPDVSNIFHKIEVNLVIIALTSVMLYLYCNSCVFRKRFYTLMFGVCIFFMFLYHHSAIFYLACLFFVWSLTGLKVNAEAKRNVFLSGGVLVILLLLDRLSNPGRYDLLAERIIFYSTHHNVFCKNLLSSSENSFLFNYFANLKNIYNTNLKSADFYFIFSVCVFLFEIIHLVYKKYKKLIFTEVELVKGQLLLLVLVGIFLIVLGFSDIKKFFTPFWVIIAVLNAGFVSDIYLLLKNKVWGKVCFFVFIFVYATYAFFILFYPEFFLKEQNDTLDAYVYKSDDFNLSESLDFFEQQKVLENDLTVTPYNYFSAGDAELFLITVFLKMKWEWGYIIPENKTFNVCFYDLRANNFSGSENLVEIEAKIRQKMISQESFWNKSFAEKKIKLKKIISYGVLQKRSESFKLTDNFYIYHADLDLADKAKSFGDRQYLLFIYEIH